MGKMSVRLVANADGKCFECGKHCMECGCWKKDIIELDDETYIKLRQTYRDKKQPERLNPEASKEEAIV